MPSVGSESYTHLAVDGGDDSIPSVHRQDLARTLRSSWITRLRLRFDPPHILGHKHTVSTLKPRTSTSVSNLGSNSAFVARRYLNLLTQKPTPLPRAGSGENHQVTSFGPFRVETPRSLPQRLDGSRDQRASSVFPQSRVQPNVSGGVRRSAFFQFRPRLTAHEGKRAAPTVHHKELMDNSTSRRSYEQQSPADPMRADPSVQDVARGRGAAHRDSAGDPSTARNFAVLQSLYCNIKHYPEKQAPTGMNEPAEHFSVWSMGIFKRKNTISCVSPAITLAMILGRKRKQSQDAFVSSNSRKLNSQD